MIGDFDADGATGSALMVRALRALRLCARRFPGAQPISLRLRIDARDRRAGRRPARPSLIVTVDNGVSSVEGVEAARALGIPVLITDHHLPGAALPRAQVIVNPNLAGLDLRESRVGRRRRRLLCRCGPGAERSAGPIFARRICSIWWRSAPSPMWCRSTATTGCWWRRGCGGFAPAAACRESARCSSRPAAGSPNSRRPIWDLRWRRD